MENLRLKDCKMKKEKKKNPKDCVVTGAFESLFVACWSIGEKLKFSFFFSFFPCKRKEFFHDFN